MERKKWEPLKVEGWCSNLEGYEGYPPDAKLIVTSDEAANQKAREEAEAAKKADKKEPERIYYASVVSTSSVPPSRRPKDHDETSFRCALSKIARITNYHLVMCCKDGGNCSLKPSTPSDS